MNTVFKVFAVAVLFLCEQTPLWASDFIINGRSYDIYRMKVYDESGNKLKDDDLKALANEGFDYNSWEQFRKRYVIDEIIIGFGGLVLGVGAILTPELKDPRIGAAIQCIGGLTSLIGIIRGRKWSDELNNWISGGCSTLQLGVTPNGIALLVTF
ncbi:MAG: hypothetical protein J6X77_00775 [Bacteroidales bacterium]|nr:hypothetical protein [Bacteroidales bacterium]